MVTMAATLGAFAIFRALMPVVHEGTASIAPTGEGANAKFTQVLTLTEMATPDDLTVDVWAKNIGTSDITGLELMSVAFGSDQNPRPHRCGGPGCAAPCWEHDLIPGSAWARGETLRVRIHLEAPVAASSWYRASLRGLSGGDSSRLFRVYPGLAASTATVTVAPSATPTATPAP
jgi:hypothetical protein